MELAGDDLGDRDLSADGAAQDHRPGKPLGLHVGARNNALTCKFSKQFDVALNPLADPAQADLDRLAVLDGVDQLSGRRSRVSPRPRWCPSR